MKIIYRQQRVVDGKRQTRTRLEDEREWTPWRNVADGENLDDHETAIGNRIFNVAGGDE